MEYLLEIGVTQLHYRRATSNVIGETGRGPFRALKSPVAGLVISEQLTCRSWAGVSEEECS